ncbi:MAG TPA: hypothetical protein VHK88_11695 [Aquihabitans sp.]|jgi:hypothetical protein|nr:hypothetical protein [Aquihabitans sp.]
MTVPSAEDADAPTDGAVPPPVLDEDGLLRHLGRWVPISDAQLPIVRLLVARFGRLVHATEVATACRDAGYAGTRAALRSLVHRVGVRVADLGLELRAVHGGGLVLDVRRPSS